MNAIKFPISYAPHRSGERGALISADAELIGMLDAATMDEAAVLVKAANLGAEKCPDGKVLVPMSRKLAEVLFDVANVHQLEALLVDGERKIDTRTLRVELSTKGVTYTAKEAAGLCEELFDATQKVLTQ